MDPKTVAGFLLGLLDVSSGPYTEIGVERAFAARALLKGLQSGDFVIVTQAKQSGEPPPPGALSE